MKASTTKILLLAALVLGLTGVAMAANFVTQTLELDIVEIAVIDVSSATVQAMTITAPAVGGDNPVDDSDNNTSVKYTSVVLADETRTITAQITDGDVPPGTQLTLTAGTPPANCGSAEAELVLSTTAQDIITGIGSCATGDPGPTLIYSFEVIDVTSLVAGSNTTPEITLTLTAGS